MSGRASLPFRARDTFLRDWCGASSLERDLLWVLVRHFFSSIRPQFRGWGEELSDSCRPRRGDRVSFRRGEGV